MKRSDFLRRVLAALLAALTLVSFTALPALAAEEGETDPETTETTETAPQPEEAEEAETEVLSIATEDDLIAFAASCTLDAWSRGMRVVLEADLDLSGMEFAPIATFGGTFDGQGHTIRGIVLTGAISPAGLFCTLQPSAALKNLTVEASVTPSGESIRVGGIVGENYGTIEGCTFNGTVSGTMSVGGIAGENKAGGTVTGCRSTGTVDGENRTGGIAGCNLGVIDDCENAAYVNVESVDPAIDLTDLDFSLSFDLSDLSNLTTANISTDSAGVAGYNAGTVSGSRNTAVIGYPHIGYNVGGIAGRSCGQVKDCVNTGAVYGRKDVGGIVGQVEPYIEMQLDEKSSKKLQTQLNELSDLVDQAADDAQGGAGGVSSRLNALSGYVDTAVEEAGNVRVNVDGTAQVTGSGSVTGGAVSNSTTTAVPGDTTASITPGEGGSVDVTPNGEGGVTVDITTGSGTSVTVDPGKIDIDHSGTASGGLDAAGGLDATAGLVAAPDLGNLTSAVNGISSQISLLNSALNGTVGTVSNDVKAINKKFNEISNTLFDAVNDAEDGVKNTVTDGSSVEIDKITLGKVSLCRNEAAVSGDINTGGIAGSMALEYALDPEDDVSSDLDGSYKRQYTYRAVLQGCVSTGEITGKRSCVGGICGRMDLGLITGCQGYGSATSTSGSYVGGIAGLTGAKIESSFAKCTLSGKNSVGGIVGSGTAETLDGGGSTVSDCISIVEIGSCEQYSGAISGSANGTFTENRFVSDSLAGLNRQSIAGSAEPVEFETLLEEDILPEEMRTFTLRFVAGDKVLKQLRFSYGESFDESVFPAIPAEDGSYAVWDCTDLSGLHFDTTVTAVYTPYTPGLASESTREDDRAILLAEGDYADGDTITVTAEPLTPTVFHVRTGSAASRLQAYFESFEAGQLPPMSANWDVVEQWSITIDSDADAPHRLRYLPPEGKADRLRIYVEQDGGWTSVPYEAIGRYLAFEIPASTARVAVVSTMPVWWIWVGIPLLLALLVFLIVHFTRKAIRKAKQARAASPAPNGPEAPAGSAVPVPPDAAAHDAADGPAAENAALLARAQTAEEKLAELEEEIRQLRASYPQSGPDSAVPQAGADAPAPGAEDACPKAEAAGTAAKPKRRVVAWLLLAAAALAVIAAALWFFVFSGLRTGLAAYDVLKNYTRQDTYQMDASAELRTGELRTQTSVSVLCTAAEGKRITELTSGGLTLYAANSAVYLPTGESYRLAAPGLTDYDGLLRLCVSLYQSAELTESKDGDLTTWQLRLSAEDMERIAAYLDPGLSDGDGPLSSAVLTMTARGSSLSELCFALETAAPASGSLTLTLTPRDGAPETVQIPEAVLSAIRSGEAPEELPMTEELFRLLRAWQTLRSQETASYDLQLKADCGPLLFDTDLALDVQQSGAQPVGCIRKGALEVYFSGDTLSDPSGNTLDLKANSWTSAASLPELAYRLACSTEASCTTSGDTATYVFTLDEAGMADAAQAIAPDLDVSNAKFTSGTLEIELDQDELSRVTVSCAGTLRVVLTETEFSLGAVLTPAERTVVFPQQALDALTN